ncbi:MAG: hypothetical protein ABIQ44_13395 [Chloroflexia bacterium]
MRDNFKALAVWAICTAAVNALAVLFAFLGAWISDAFHLTMRGLPGTGPQPLADQFFLGLAGFLALFNVLMGAVLVLLLVWLVGSAIVLLVTNLRNIYFKQKHIRRI